MSKQIVIIGGGISGLAVLHQLKKRFGDNSDVKVVLLEKDAHVGGKIGTVNRNGFIFETGPNGFLDSKESTLRLAEEIGLSDELIPASPQANERYIFNQGELEPLPTKPSEFFKFKSLSWGDKLRIPLEFFTAKGKNAQESVFDFAARRLGQRVAEILVDPMVSGIFAGDAHKLNMREAFPRVYEIEQEYGSLLRAKFKIHDQKSAAKQNLWSFKGGMGQLCSALAKKYTDFIRTGEAVLQISPAGDGYVIETNKAKYFADHLFMCTPAGFAGWALTDINPPLAKALSQIPYAPVAVVGLGYQRSQIKNLPSGFGYLIPSSEQRKALGVLLSSNIFNDRCAEDRVTVQVMLGGALNPQLTAESQEQLIALAKIEIGETLGVQGEPLEQFVTIWEKGIPQYTQEYAELKATIEQEMQKHKNLLLVGNYLYGVAVNDCTTRAEQVVRQFQID